MLLAASTTVAALSVFAVVGTPSARALPLPPDTVVTTQASDGFATGTVAGLAGVSRTGAATYRVPLWSVPGRAGIEPHLALVYSSDTRDGILGVGWSLAGLSSIVRCPRSVALDGVALPVTFVDGPDGDRYCLNNSRLMLVSGQYGAAGSEYRPESRPDTKLVLVKTDSSGPLVFKEFRKDGTIATYGDLNGKATSEGKRVVPTPLPSQFRRNGRLAWHLAREEDRYGNYLTVSYKHVRAKAVEVFPSRISYTGFSSPTAPLSPDRGVVFRYESRPDVADGYVAGLHTRGTVRLATIAMVAGTTIWRQYHLHYSSSSTTRRSLLKGLDECDGDGICKLPTRFDWTVGRSTFTYIPFAGGSGGGWGDLNLDGKADFLDREIDSRRTARWYGRFFARLSTGTGSSDRVPVPLPVLPPLECPDGEDHVYDQFGAASSQALVDFDNDGRADFVGARYKLHVSGELPDTVYCSVTRSIELYRNITPPGSTAIAFTRTFVEPYTPVTAGDEPRFADLDGDGLPEMIADSHSSGYGFRRNLGNGQFGAYETFPGSLPEWSNTVGGLIVSADGSNRAQVLMRKTNESVLWQGGTTQSSKTFDPTSLSVKTTPANCSRYANRCGTFGFYYMADVNRDGLTDALMVTDSPNQEVYVAINTGIGFTAPVRWSVDGNLGPFVNSSLGQMFITVSDFDGDGKDDLLSRAGFWLLRSGINGKFSSFTLPGMVSDASFGGGATFDFNGDGLLDYFLMADAGEGVYLRNGPRPDLLERVSDGFGAFDQFAYTSSGNSNVYSRGSTLPAYPLSAAISGQPLVSEWSIGQASHVERTFSYVYGQSRANLRGRGWLGFAQVTATDSATGQVTQTAYDVETRVGSAYPGADLVTHERSTVRVGQKRIESDLTNSYVQRADVNGVLSLSTVDSVMLETETLGRLPTVPIRRVHSQTEFDGEGDVNSQNTEVAWDAQGGGFAKRISTALHATYDYDVTNWIIGKLRTAEVESTDVTGAKSVRRRRLEFDHRTGKYTKIIVEPGSSDPAIHLEMTFEYEAHGLLHAIETADLTGAKRRVTVDYDQQRSIYPEVVTNPAGQTVETVYQDGLGVLASEKDTDGVVSSWRYDGFGRLRSELSPYGDNLSVSYQPATTGGLQIAQSRTGQSAVVQSFDARGRERQRRWQSFDGRWIFQDRDYDSADRETAVSLPHFSDVAAQTVTRTFDPLGRVTQIKSPDGTTQQLSYFGLSARLLDQQGNQSVLQADGVGNITRSASIDRQGKQIATEMKYGPFNLLGEVTDPGGNSTRLYYDIRGRRELVSNPDTGWSSTFYNAFSQTTGTSTAMGGFVSYDIDLLGRVKAVHTAAGNSTFEWDTAPHGVGRLASATGSGGVKTEFAYDPLGRNIEKTWTVDGQQLSVATTYDSFGRLATVSYPEVQQRRLVTRRDYTISGELRSIRNGNTGRSYWQIDSQDAWGDVVKERYGNGVVTTHKYDSLGRLRRISSKGTRGPVQDVEYDYDVFGSVSARRDALTHINEFFDYDNLRRLKHWTIKGSPASAKYEFGYDDTGNLLTRQLLSGAGASQKNTYGGVWPPHAIATSDSNGTVVKYGYDLEGNQTTGPNRTITYTPFNLPGTESGPNFSASFQYDAFNNQVLRQAGNSKTITLDDTYEQRSGTKPLHVFRINDGGRTAAEVTWSGGPGDEDVLYLHPDALGSPDAITNRRGSVVDLQRFDPFGAARDPQTLLPRTSGLTSSSRAGFTGYDAADELGLVNAGGRLYDPEVGRYLSADPFVSSTLNTQALNRYSYASNSPFAYRDPTGLDENGGTISGNFDTGGDVNVTTTTDLDQYSTSYGQADWAPQPSHRASSEINDGGLKSAALWFAKQAVTGAKVLAGMQVAMDEMWTSMTGLDRETTWELLQDPVKMAEYELGLVKDFVMGPPPFQKLPDSLVTAWDQNGVMGVVDLLNPMTRVYQNAYMAQQAYSSNKLVEYGYYSTHFGVAVVDTVMVADGVASLVTRAPVLAGGVVPLQTPDAIEIGLGPYANKSVPSSTPLRATTAERAALKGERCHSCGTLNYGTKTGLPYGDHQPPTSLEPTGQRIYPQCKACSNAQGGWTSRLIWYLRRF